MGHSTEGFWEALDITSCNSLQACRNDSTNGERTELAGKHHLPDVPYGKNSLPLSLFSHIVLTNGLDIQTTISEARWVSGQYVACVTTTDNFIFLHQSNCLFKEL
jgi:hypothetical protein